MIGFSLIEMRRALVRSLNGRCVQVGSVVLAKDGEQHENCATCETRCGSGSIGFSGGVEVARVWGSDAIELRWLCPACRREVTQETTALASLADAEEAKRDPLCYACRKPANAEVTGLGRNRSNDD